MIKKIQISFKILSFLIVFLAPLLILNIKKAEMATSPYKSSSSNSSSSMSYTPMEEVPEQGRPADFYVYINAIYKFGIGAVGVCAMLMIMIGGYMYITASSAGNNASTEKAKGVITDAIVGLLLALGSYLILYIINPDLVKIKKVQPGGTTTSLSSSSSSASSEEISSCSEIPNQKPAQCSDASSSLVSLLVCVANKLGKDNIQISSISDSNGGVNCYSKYTAKCTTDPEPNCCYHSKNSCHYGGTQCSDGSHAVDFSTKGSKASNSEIKSAVTGCGGKALDEGNHVHASIGGSTCGCDINL